MSDFSQVVSAPPGRFDGLDRPYSADDVLRLRGSFPIEHTLARRSALKLWELLKQDDPVRALGAVTGNQAMQMVRAGLDAIYLSGWQVAADANTAGAMYPDQSLYPANAGPELARRINRTLQRADQIEHMEGGAKRDWFVPIVADAEAGFGGPLNCFEIMKAFIEAGAAGELRVDVQRIVIAGQPVEARLPGMGALGQHHVGRPVTRRRSEPPPAFAAEPAAAADERRVHGGGEMLTVDADLRGRVDDRVLALVPDGAHPGVDRHLALYRHGAVQAEALLAVQH